MEHESTTQSSDSLDGTASSTPVRVYRQPEENLSIIESQPGVFTIVTVGKTSPTTTITNSYKTNMFTCKPNHDDSKRKSWKVADMEHAIIEVRRKSMGFKKASKAFNVPRSTLFRLASQTNKSPAEAAITKLGRRPVYPPHLRKRKRKLKLSDGTSTQAARKEYEDENPVVTVAHASDPSPTMSPDAVEDPLAVTGMQLQTEVSAVDSATVAGDLHPSVMDDSDVLIEYFGDPTHDHHLDEPGAQVFMDPDTKSIAETLLHLRAEKLLHEMDRLKLHREKMEAEKRNIKLRTEILALRKQLSVKDQICQLSSEPSRSSESDSVAASGEDSVSGVSVYDEQVIILQKPLDSVQLTPDIKGSAGMSRVTLNLHKDKPLKAGKRVTVKLLQPSRIIQQGQRVELSETSNKSVGHIIAQNCGVSLQGGDIEGLDRHIVPVKRKVTLLQGRTSVGKCNTLSSETRNVQEHPETCKNLSLYENSSQILNSHSDSGAENRNVRRSVGDDISESANENSLNAQFNPNECDTSPRSVLDTGQDISLSKRMKTEYYRYSESEPS